MTLERWAGARHVLAVRLDAIGDLLMTTPALRALRGLPGRPRLTLLTSPAGAAAAPLIPEVDEVVAYAAPWMKAPPEAEASVDLAVVRRLADAEIDGAVIFTVYSQSPWPAAFLCRLAGIPLRLSHGRENPYHLLTDWVRESEPEREVRHEVVRQLELVAHIGAKDVASGLSLRVPDDARERVRARLAALGIRPGQRFILIHPGASAPSRRYPSERFARVAANLVATGERVVLVGGQEDAPVLREIACASGAAWIGETSLGEMTALVAAASVLVGNNSGPAHVAAAVGTPVVVLYALTNPQHAPWQVTSRVLFRTVPCAFCYKSTCPEGHHACLRHVAPDEVVAAVRDLL